MKFAMRHGHYHQKAKRNLLIPAQDVHVTRMEGKKFSSPSGMTPSQVPNGLQGLTRLEEMLIARVFPVISVYTKPGGQKAYKGHCINFSQVIQELANSLPRYPTELPVMVVSVIGKDNTYKDFTVRRSLRTQTYCL